MQCLWLTHGTKIHFVGRITIAGDEYISAAVKLSTINRLTFHIPHYNYKYLMGAVFRLLVDVLPRPEFCRLSLDYFGKIEILQAHGSEQTVIGEWKSGIAKQGLLPYENKILIRFRCCATVDSWASLSEHEERLITRSVS